MQCSILQLNRLAIILDDAEADLVRVEPSPTHRLDGTVFARIDGASHVIDRDGRELPAADYVFGTLAPVAMR